jgi:hypothetical protein
MSAVLKRDDHGVLLNYGDPGAKHRHHVEQRPQVADRQRMQLLKAERSLLTIWVIAENLNLSDIAMTRIADELETIRRALDIKRRDYGMAPSVEEAA